MKVYLGKQESIGNVKVPVEDSSTDEYTDLKGMLKLSIYVKKEDFPDVMDYFEKWLYIYRNESEFRGKGDETRSLSDLFQKVDALGALHLETAKMVKELADKESQDG